ncbi:hypothetical protein I4U23_019950 [Adineta vaga]|nr:hypothetical protein I4U23_019950 [Adineta vaga]
MERYQSTRIGFVPKSSSFQHSTKVVPISNPQRKIQTNAFPPLDPSLISTFSTNSTTTTTTTSFYCPPVVYSVTFTSGVYSPILCSIWTSFTASLTCSNYTSFSLNGTYDPNGYTATDRTVVNGVAIALRTSTTYVGNSNGITWRVGSCGGSELTTTGSICQCATGNTLRPCVGGASFGGLASSSCSAPTQVITLSFE